MKARTILSVFAALAFAGASIGADSCGSTSDSGGNSDSNATPSARQPGRPFHATNSQVHRLVDDALGNKVAGSDLRRVRSVDCFHRRTCVINYNADTPFVKSEKTLLEEARPIWKKLFSDHKLRKARIVTWGETTSVGGKEGRSAVMRVTCDRAANAEIDWDEIDSHGIEALCDYVPLVRFD